jgi:hypothetical protein
MLTDCGEYRPRLIELARGTAGQDERRELKAHVDLCAECARVLDEQLMLSAALGTLSAEEMPEMAEIEARVLAEFDRSVWQRRRASLWVFAAGLAAAALVGAVALQHRAPANRQDAAPVVSTAQAPEPVEVPAPRQVSAAPVARVRHVVAAPPVQQNSQPFVPIPYTVPLAPEERATVVNMQVPVAALIAAGFEVATADPGAVVDADVLVSQDGRARAIRFNSK